MSKFSEWGLGGKPTDPTPNQQPATPQTPQIQQPPKADNTNKKKRPARDYKINTMVYREYGFLMEDARRAVRLQTGRNPKIAEVLELAFEALEEKMTASGHWEQE